MTVRDNLSALLGEKRFVAAIKRFEELQAQSGRAFLIGAGCSKCAGLPLTSELTEKALKAEKNDDTSKTILTAIRNLFDGAASANIQELRERADRPACYR